MARYIYLNDSHEQDMKIFQKEHLHAFRDLEDMLEESEDIRSLRILNELSNSYFGILRIINENSKHISDDELTEVTVCIKGD